MNKTAPVKNASTQTKRTSVAQPFFQPKLRVNQPNDIYEQQADAAAEKIMQMEKPQPQQNFFAAAPTFQNTKITAASPEPMVQRQDDDKQATPPSAPVAKPVAKLDNGQKIDLTIHSEPGMGKDSDDTTGNLGNSLPGTAQTNGVPNFAEVSIVLTGKRLYNFRDYNNDVGKAWQDTHQLVLNWRLDKMAANVIDRLPSFAKPDLDGKSPDIYLTDKMVNISVGASNSRDNPSFDDGTGFVIPIWSKKKHF